MSQPIHPRQVYTNLDSQKYADITILAIEEGWAMCKKPTGVPFLYPVKGFETDIIKHCGYTLKCLDFDYSGFYVVYEDPEYVVAGVGSYKTPGDAMAAIDLYIENY